MWHWLRRRFITGFFVTIPIVVSVVAIVWVFRWVDGITAGVLGPAAQPGAEDGSGFYVPGLGVLVTATLILAVGVLATNVFGRRVFERTEQLLLQVPLFKTVYGPVRQLVSAFSPDNEVGFKRMVLVDDPARGYLLGFLTKEFTMDRGNGPEPLLAVYVPTNHLYLGDILICRPDRVVFPDMTVEEGVRVFFTGGTALPQHMGTGEAHLVRRADRIESGRSG
jgi:uncharacterized membrane protein